jgi:preprotein translocase subunit SecY
MTFTAGTAFVVWLGELITEKGLGNGTSMIIFAGIVSSIPGAIITVYQTYLMPNGVFAPWGIAYAVGLLVVAIAVIALVVFFTDAERRIPVQYAKRVVGRKMYGGQSSNLPIKVNMTGVMPMIFASSIVSIVPTIEMFVQPKKGTFWYGFFNLFSTDSVVYAILTFVLIIAFAYFYTSISFNPVEVANNLKQNGGSVPGIRPGRPTAEYITKILSRVTFIGAILLSVVAVLPLIANIISGGNFSILAFGGSSIIIVVGVILETIREIEAQMTMRHYKGFLE